jgi:glycosyltransferase involved in cell wall biosynthesis
MNNNQPKVLMISKALVVGAYHNKLEAMARLGMELHLIIPTHYGNQRPEILHGNGYTIHVLPIIFSGKNHFHFYPHLKHYIQNIKPDILHIDEEAHSFVTYYAMRYAVQFHIPALFFNWQNIYKRYPWPFCEFEQYNFSHAAVGIAGSKEIREVLLKKGCTKIEIPIIPQFGVDTILYCSIPQQELRKQLFEDAKKIIGFAGRFVEEKGILDLLDAASLLSETTHVALIGSGPQQSTIERRIQQLHLEHRVHLLGSVKSTAMPKYLNIMDCLVLPSLTRPNWKEQFGRILIEAMACEVPVVGSSSGEISNVIGDAGYIYPEGDSKKLADVLQQLLGNEERRRKIGAAGRTRVEQCFTQQKIAHDTLQVYQMMLQGWKNQ